MILHKVSTSPFHDDALAQCLSLMAADDGLLLMQDGVYAVHGQQAWTEKLSQVRHLYLLDEDMQARAVSPGEVKARIVNYSEFVNLSLHYQKVMSW